MNCCNNPFPYQDDQYMQSGQGMAMNQGMGQCCNPTCNVVNRYFVTDVPHVCNHHTHIVNNCIKRHYVVPQYTQSEETVYIDECCGENPRPTGFGPNLF